MLSLMITRERKSELTQQYTRAVKGSTKDETRHEWLIYLASLWKEDGDTRVFMDIRAPARTNGAEVDLQFMRGMITPRQFFLRLRAECADVYAADLTTYGLATIDQTTPAYQTLTREAALEVLEAFEGVDINNPTAVCLAMATTWHRLVAQLHELYGLPSPRELRGEKMHEESDAETAVLEIDDFQTKMTPGKRRGWEAKVE